MSVPGLTLISATSIMNLSVARASCDGIAMAPLCAMLVYDTLEPESTSLLWRSGVSLP